jgi:protein-S-isoprenylcysteine O-methyltransferase Ste14
LEFLLKIENIVKPQRLCISVYVNKTIESLYTLSTFFSHILAGGGGKPWFESSYWCAKVVPFEFIPNTIGLVGIIIVLVAWVKTPAGQPVARGVYRFSRHPMYVAMVWILFGVSVISASWVFLLFAIITAVGVTRPFSVKIEEAQCLGHYGDAYREYMNRTPRWIGIPKSE